MCYRYHHCVVDPDTYVVFVIDSRTGASFAYISLGCLNRIPASWMQRLFSAMQDDEHATHFRSNKAWIVLLKHTEQDVG